MIFHRQRANGANTIGMRIMLNVKIDRKTKNDQIKSEHHLIFLFTDMTLNASNVMEKLFFPGCNVVK